MNRKGDDDIKIRRLSDMEREVLVLGTKIEKLKEENTKLEMDLESARQSTHEFNGFFISERKKYEHLERMTKKGSSGEAIVSLVEDCAFHESEIKKLEAKYFTQGQILESYKKAILKSEERAAKNGFITKWFGR